MKDLHAEILRSIRKVPMLSPSAAQLLKVTSNPHHSQADVIRIVEHDAALTSTVLKVVNSATFARQMPIASISRAISVIGEDMVVGISLAEAASPLFQDKLQGYAGEGGDLWRHDLRTALAAKRIARHAITVVQEDVAFTSGLLHDIGKAILSDFLKEGMNSILIALGEGRIKDYINAEQEQLGTNHCAVGFELAQYWGLPEPLPSVIRHHHDPAVAEPGVRPLAYTIHLADMVAMMGGTGTGADTLRYGLDPQYPQYIALSSQKLALIMIEVETEYVNTVASLGG